MPYLEAIFIFPIKALDGIRCTSARVLPSGALVHDREWAICDEQGRFVNGKRKAGVHLLRASLDLRTGTVCLQVQGAEQRHVFHVDQERSALEAWLGNYFGFPVKVLQNSAAGFPDDTKAAGPTVLSTGTIEEVASWFPQIGGHQIRARFRANLEIGEVPAFWEDQLFAEKGSVVRFRIGDVQLEGMNHCQRCVVPTRDPLMGDVYLGFKEIFMAKRRETLPSWATLSRFNHFFRLSVNTRIPESEAGKTLEVGADVEVLGVRRGCEA